MGNSGRDRLDGRGADHATASALATRRHADEKDHDTSVRHLDERGAPCPSISVVICAYTQSRFKELVRAVESVLRQSPPADRIVVVIDHNPELLARARVAFPDALVVANEGRPGLCGARNTGVRQVTSEIVAFLDDDARAAADWLEQLGRGFGHGRAIGLGGWVDPRWQGAPPRWLAPELYWVVGCSYRGLPTRVVPIRNGIGANMAFRRRALLAVGGFREGVGQGPDSQLRDDETDAAIRIRMQLPGAEILHFPAARVDHMVPADRASWRYLLSRCWSEGQGKAILAREHGPAAALASERAYAFRTLPTGVVHGLLDVARGDITGAERAASIIFGLSLTVAGYVFGRLSSLR